MEQPEDKMPWDLEVRKRKVEKKLESYATAPVATRERQLMPLVESGLTPEQAVTVERELMELTLETNRSFDQTMKMYLVAGNMERLRKVENKIKTNFLFYAPLTKEAVEEVLAMSDETVSTGPDEYVEVPGKTGLHKVCKNKKLPPLQRPLRKLTFKDLVDLHKETTYQMYASQHPMQGLEGTLRCQLMRPDLGDLVRVFDNTPDELKELLSCAVWLRKSINDLLRIDPDVITLELTYEGSIFFTIKKGNYTVFIQHFIDPHSLEDGDDEAFLTIFDGKEKLPSFSGQINDVIFQLHQSNLL